MAIAVFLPLPGSTPLALPARRRGDFFAAGRNIYLVIFAGMIRYTIYQTGDSAEMVRLLAEVFPLHDPPAVALGLTAEDFAPFVELLLANAAAAATTVLARSTETGEMVGALLTEDSAAGLPEGMSHLSDKFNPIFDILGQLESEYRAGQTPAPGECLHLFLLGVSPRYVRQGIAQTLVATSLACAKRRGYRIAVTEATNQTSQHIFRKMGFIERVGMAYRDHRFQGQAYFTTIAEQGGPMLMERQLEP